MPIVFFSRCKPQDVDAIDIVLKYKKVFIGYPMPAPDAQYDPHNLHSCLIDPTAPDDVWRSARARTSVRRQYNQNRNLIHKVDAEEGRIALVPRPSRGVIYCGKIKDKFQLVNDPIWYNEYLSVRASAGATSDGPDCWHSADVAQCWTVEEWVAIPLPRIPASIRRSLFGRSTYGVIHPDHDIGLDPFEVIATIMRSENISVSSWTCDPLQVERRLVDNITPSALEHLIVSLLQLEHENEVWSHVGGSGDGGIDGVGAAENGSVSALLQCKWQYWGGDIFYDPTLWNPRIDNIKRYLASLRYPVGVRIPDGVEFLDRPAIAKLILRHAARLPQAMSMRIGCPSK